MIKAKLIFVLVPVVGILLAVMSIVLVLDMRVPADESYQTGFQSNARQITDTPKGHPDLVAQYHHDIRSSLDGINEYPMAYRIGELNRAMAAAAKTPGIKIGWKARGPGNVGGRTRPILVDPDDRFKTWWAGSVSGGLWKTVDRGQTWVPVTEHLSNLSVSSLAMAASNHNVIYMGTGEGFYNLGRVAGDGIFKSSDRGRTWKHLESTTTEEDFRHVFRLAVDPSNPDIVVAAAGRSIFRTEDGGETWIKVYTGERNVHDLRAQPGNFNRQIAAPFAERILYSEDAGKTWQRAPMFSSDIIGRTELAYSTSHPEIAYAAAEHGDNRAVLLYRSDDGGQTWWPTRRWPGTDYDPNWLTRTGWYNNTLLVHPFNPNIVFAGGVFLVRVLIRTSNDTGGMPTDIDFGGAESWLNLVDFGASALDGRASYLNPDAVDVSTADYANIEIRFGAGSQLAHRFVVSETAGTHGNGGDGVPWSGFSYADYVEVPFQVWDVVNNRQLMVSFRDQADDGEFNLIEFFVTSDPDTRDVQSHEYLIIHKYDYDAAAAHDNIANDGGLVHGMLYFVWPTLSSGATWDAANLPSQNATLEFQRGTLYHREIDKGLDVRNNAHVDHHDLVPIPVDSTDGTFWVLNANDGGIALSADSGLTFVELDRAGSGYNTSQFYGVAKAPGQNAYMGGMQDNGSYMSGEDPHSGQAWTHVLGGDGFESVWHATDPNLVLGSFQFTHIERSADGGQTWREQVEGDPSYGIFITSLGYAPSSPDNVYTAKENAVWRSTDFGVSWSQTSISSGFPKTLGNKVRVSEADPNVVWAGAGLEDSRWAMIHVSKDAGLTFEQAALPEIDRAPNTWISGLATHPTEPGTAYALFSRYQHAKVLETKDYGATWTDISGFSGSPDGRSTKGFPDVAINDLVVMPHATNTIWVGTEIGLFTTRSYGSWWQYANNGLPPVSIWRMKIRDDEVVLGTHGRGVWTVPLSEVRVGVEEGLAEVPSDFKLLQNYPNPFNASTTIQFQVPEPSGVRLTVYDAAGRRIAVLADRVYATGKHELQWDASGYASGPYFYRLETEGRLIRARQMTLVK